MQLSTSSILCIICTLWNFVQNSLLYFPTANIQCYNKIQFGTCDQMVITPVKSACLLQMCAYSLTHKWSSPVTVHYFRSLSSIVAAATSQVCTSAIISLQVIKKCDNGMASNRTARKKNCRKKFNQFKNVNGQILLTCAKTCWSCNPTFFPQEHRTG